MTRLLIAVSGLIACPLLAGDTDSELYETIKRLDAVVFEAGFNQCDIEKLGTVIDDSLEFYHDQGGLLYGKQAFLESMRNGICKLDYKARRSLDEASLEIFPLYNNGVLYGVIERGVHRFHAKYPDKPEYPTGIAKFSLVWLLKDGEWKMAEALSFDHEPLN